MLFRVLISFSLLAGLIQAGIVPNRYIVEFSTEPVASRFGSFSAARTDVQSTAAVTHRARIQREQAQARIALESKGVKVLDQVDTVANALFIEISSSDPQPWLTLPNVIKVTPVHSVSLLLDRAVIVNKITDAWAQIGGSANSGRGVKIAILDTGIDISHPAFQNSPLTVPAGFPLATNSSDTTFTNNKVIVARSYVSLLDSRDPDLSARDHVGHGTALAMISAGGTVAAPAATLTGIAPAAWLGSYKIFGTPGANDNSNDAAILKALDDAVKDGMDVVNLSVGSDIASRLGDDVEVQAVERATQAGVIVVVAAGNNGTDLGTIASPATAPDAIAAGAQWNSRIFSASIQVSGLSPLLAIPGNGPAPSSPITAPLADVATLDTTGLTCASLPSGSLSNKVALILRGNCTFETKLNNAAKAGAVAGIIYVTAASPDPFPIDAGTATLPAETISNSDGVALKQAIAAGTASLATVTFTLSPVSVDAARVTSFSAAGPNVDYSIKPDLTAVGQDYYVATQSFDPSGDMYSPNGYIVVDGTSFSTPTIAGAAALLKAARPGLTLAQYRSLLINSATPLKFGTLPASVQQAGAGSLNAGASLLATAAAYPTSLSFGAGGAFPQGVVNLTISNTGTAADTFTFRAVPSGTSPAPAISADSIRLEAGASSTVAVTLAASNLLPGGYEGFVVISGANGTVDTRVPYWYGVISTIPVTITDLDSTTSGARGSRQTDAITFHVVDAAGIPITAITPQVTVTAGGGSVLAVKSYDSDSPGLFGVTVRLGTLAGTNTFHVVAGDISADFNITGQ